MRRHTDDWNQIVTIGGIEPVEQERAIPERPAWHAEANCGRNGILGDDPLERTRFMFPGRGELAAEVKAVCQGCPVAAQCLSAAMANRELFGVWAGTSDRMRRRMRRAVPAVAYRVAKTCDMCGTSFMGRSSNSRYCTEPCRKAAARGAVARFGAKAS